MEFSEPAKYLHPERGKMWEKLKALCVKCWKSSENEDSDSDKSDRDSDSDTGPKTPKNR